MVLVTGGTGLVGSHLLLQLLKKGEKVRVLIRKKSNKENIKKVFAFYTAKSDMLFDKIEWFIGDIIDPLSLQEALVGIDKVYHTAAYVSFDKKERQNILTYNVEGTGLLADLANESGVQKFCFVSSIATLGNANDSGFVDEQCSWSGDDGRSVYSISKYRAEMEVWRAISEGLNAVIINPSVILGPGDWSRSSAKLFSTIYKGMQFYTKGVTGYVDVNDVVKVMITLMDSEISNERFIVSEGNYSFEYLFKAIAIALGKKPPSIYATPFLQKLALLGSSLVSFLTNKPPVFTKETIRAGNNQTHYSSKKLIDILGISFIPIGDSIQAVADKYLLGVKNRNSG